MEATLQEKYMFMILYLMNQFSNKRQGIILDSQISIQYPSILNEILKIFLDKYKLDLNVVTTEAECLKAESYLSEYLSCILKGDLSSSVEEESILLKESIELKKTDIISAKVILDDHIKELFSDLKISKVSIDNWFLTPDYIRYFKIGSNENIIATRIIPYGNTKKILFYHMGVDRKFSIIQSYKVCTVFVIDYEMFKDMISSPIRIFLFMLDRFGIDMNLNGTVKKLFFRVKQLTKSSIKVNSTSKKLYSSFQTFQNSNRERYLSFVYSVDLEGYLKDFKNRKI